MATRIEILEATDYTQDVARRLLGPDPVVVVAHHQTRGRGRRGADWVSAPRSVAVSVAWRPGWPSASLPTLGLVAGLAATDVADVELKWPNDLVRPGGKVGGILAEGVDGGVVVGLGMNLWWPDAPDGMAALGVDDPGSEAVVEIGGAWANDLLRRAAEGPERWGRAEYRAKSHTIGRRVAWLPDGQGRAVDVDETGGLVVETDDGIVVLRSGEVRELRAVD
ncbi:MAG: biotin--[acetyl-CoA-carboxylase] ligase [Acidimicrobiia bacterium]